MIQTRFENEQFNSLPLLFTNNRLRNDYITTDRPDSSQLVDLHIYIIPKTVWKNVQHLAQNEAMDDAVSAGFVRVSPDIKLRNLRETIELLCGKENNFPREFIFLRSVGRCLTRVKQTQENELKVKNYRPPQTLASEIYLLEGRHEDYGNIPSASPALSSASYVFGNRRQHRFNLDDHNQELSRLSHHCNRKPLRIEKDNLPALNTNHVTYRRALSSRKSGSRFTQIVSDLDESSPNTSVVTSVTSRELVKLKEEQERLRRRQAELDRIRRAAEEKKLNSEHEENERQRRRLEKEQLEREENERQRRRLEKEQLEREENERQCRRQEQLEREEKERQRRRLEQLEREEKERQRHRQEQLEREEKERQRHRQEQLEREENERQLRRLEQLEREEKERQRRREEREQFDRDEQERRRRLRRQQKAEAERRRLQKLELAATTIQASFRGYQERQTFRERQKNSMKNRSRKSSKKSNTTFRNEKKIDINDDELSDSSHIISRTSIGSTSDLDSNPSRPETRTIKKEKRKNIPSNSSSSSSLSSSLHLKTEDLSIKNKLDTDEEKRFATVTKTRHSDEEILPISTPDINDDDTYELKRREVDTKRYQQSDEEKRKAKELEDQRRRELSKRQLPEDVQLLRARLEELRTGRVSLEKHRDEVIKQLRHMHQRITLRRRDARDMWKKKYFQEKKKTPAIEERSTQLKTDLELINGKIVQIIDHETKHAVQVGYSKEAELGNLILKIVRIQYEVQDLQHQLDQAKLRLTTDLKLRNQADNECQLLKHELTQAKMNLTHIKNRIAV